MKNQNRSEYWREYYLKTKSKRKEKRQYYFKKWLEENKDENNNYQKEYQLKNRKSLSNKANAYLKERRKNDVEYKLIAYTRNRLYHVIKKGFKLNRNRTIDEIGCSITEYKNHLESQFTENMCWDNYGECWEIDHIKPLSKGGTFHYTNTQPLTVTENRSKGNR
tara:strand:+ start:49 stop:540 length:492 start_codon:yes stop_codon:yes gene_type:complete